MIKQNQEKNWCQFEHTTNKNEILFELIVKHITCHNFIPDLIFSPGRIKAIKKLFII